MLLKITFLFIQCQWKRMCSHYWDYVAFAKACIIQTWLFSSLEQNMSDSAQIYIYSSKKVLHHSLLFLCILNFQYLRNLEKWSDQAQIFRESFLNPLLLFLKRPVVLRDEIIFVQKPHFWPKMQNTVEPALKTTWFKRPPVYKDHFKFLPMFFPLKWTWFQGPPV